MHVSFSNASSTYDLNAIWGAGAQENATITQLFYSCMVRDFIDSGPEIIESMNASSPFPSNGVGYYTHKWYCKLPGGMSHWGLYIIRVKNKNA